MARFFANKKKEVPPTVVEPEIETVEEVELMPSDSVEYFQEKLEQIKNREELAHFKNTENIIVDFFSELSREEDGREAERKKLELKLKKLEEQHKEKAKALILEMDAAKKEELEKEVQEISVQILTLKVQVEVYENSTYFNDRKENRLKLKKLFQKYREAGSDAARTKEITAALSEIDPVIRDLENMREKLYTELKRKVYDSWDYPSREPYYTRFAADSLVNEVRIHENKYAISENFGKEIFERWLNENTTISFEAYLKNRLGKQEGLQ